MSGGNCRKLRNAMFVVALLAVIAVGFVAFESDDSFAETKSEAVKDGSANTIGNYAFANCVKNSLTPVSPYLLPTYSTPLSADI